MFRLTITLLAFAALHSTWRPVEDTPEEIPAFDPPEAVAALSAIENVSFRRNEDNQIESICVHHGAKIERVTRLLAQLRSVRRLEIHWGTVTPADLARIGRVQQLESLHLCHVELRDEHLVHLARLEQLRYLDVSWNALSGDGLRQLAKLKRLESLVIYRTQLNDAALLHLERLPKLKRVLAGATQITAAGVDRLTRVLPDCQVQWAGNL